MSRGAWRRFARVIVGQELQYNTATRIHNSQHRCLLHTTKRKQVCASLANLAEFNEPLGGNEQRLPVQQDSKVMSAFRFTHAIVCGVTKSYAESAVGLNSKVDFEKLKKQHEEYVQALREVGLDIIEMTPDENHPDCTFVEDTAVVCNGTALLTKPGHSTREKEVEYMSTILKNDLELPVIEIKDPKATLDGGDVLFTGREFFVGLSGRTNQAGVSALASAFPEFPCSAIKVDNCLHLKDFITMAGPDVMVVGPSAEARDALKRVEREATFQYQKLMLAEDEASNVVFVNGTLLYRSKEECPESAKIIEEQLSHWTLKPMNFSEFSKAHGSLTCCSIRIIKN